MSSFLLICSIKLVLRLAYALCKNANTAPQPKPVPDPEATGVLERDPLFLPPLSDERMG